MHLIYNFPSKRRFLNIYSNLHKYEGNRLRSNNSSKELLYNTHHHNNNDNIDKRCFTTSTRCLFNTLLLGLCLCSITTLRLVSFSDHIHHSDLVVEPPILRTGKQFDQPPLLQLRFNYTNLERLSIIAKEIEFMQNNCNITKRGIYYHTNGSGLGSELHIYSIVLCTALEMKHVRFSTGGNWIYNDQQLCSKTSTQHTPMGCYFPQAEPICPIDALKTVETFDISYYDRYTCPTVTERAGNNGDHSNVRAATTEYLFTRVSSLVQQEAIRQLNLLFNDVGIIPKNLITVHIRWGDKDGEMKLVPIQNYTNAIQQIVDQRKAKRTLKQQHHDDNTKGNRPVVERKGTMKVTDDDDDDDEEVNIFLATEDPEVVKQFMLMKPSHWNVYLDQYYIEMLPYRMKMGNVFNINALYASDSQINGHNGLIALGSLLVALEANDYILTTASNWSRLINELRKNIINPRCNNCTTMIDLLYDEL